MKKKLIIVAIVLSEICMLLIHPMIAKSVSVQKINASDFSMQSMLYYFDDDSWVYSASCSSADDTRYQINVDFRCWGTDILSTYPQMTVEIWDKDADEWDNILAKKLTIKVAGNEYEYQLIESNPSWKPDTHVGITFLLPSDNDLIKDFASAEECLLVAETDDNTYTWVITGNDYENFFLPYIQDMLKYDFLHNIEENETNVQLLLYSPARTVHKDTGYSLTFYKSSSEPEEGYSFSEDSSAIEQASKSVFYVEMYDQENNCLGNASGFVSFDEHYFVTNEHVINDVAYLIVWDNSGNSYILNQVIAIDTDHDIAILKFAEGQKYISLMLDTNENLKRGMPVVTIGSKNLQVIAHVGIISALPVLNQYAGDACIQYSAPTSQESNGGCLIGDNGKVIGITSAISTEGQYIGVAVPVKYLIELYSKMKSNVYDVMGSNNSNNSSILEEKGKKKEDYTIITGGKINTIVPISKETDFDSYISDEMNITVQEFLNRYDEIRSIKFKNAPSIKNRTVKELNSWSNEYYINADADAGIGTKLIWKKKTSEGDINNLDVPLEQIVQFYHLTYHNTSLKENTRACLAVFSDDEHLMDKLIDFYKKNDCRDNGQYAGLVTSEGYLIYYFRNNLGDEAFCIYFVAH